MISLSYVSPPSEPMNLGMVLGTPSYPRGVTCQVHGGGKWWGWSQVQAFRNG